MRRTHPTMAADISVLAFNTNPDNTVHLPAKNDIAEAPHRLMTVSPTTVEARLLELWKPAWDMSQLARHLIANSELAKSLINDYPGFTASGLMCNPNASYPDHPEHTNVGNAEWQACIKNEYPYADIQDRRVMHMILCFWKCSDGSYILQYELARFIGQLFDLVGKQLE